MAKKAETDRFTISLPHKLNAQFNSRRKGLDMTRAELIRILIRAFNNGEIVINEENLCY